MSRPPDPDTVRVSAELVPGEVLLWVCRPHYRLRTNSVLVISAGSLPFFAMAAMFAWAIGIASGYGTWYVAAVLLAVAIVLGLAFLWERARRATIYAITSTRVLIVGRGALITLPIRAIAEWSCDERGDGRGDLVFGRIHRFHLTTEDDVPPTGLYNIANVRAVHALLDSAQRAGFNLPPRDPGLAAGLAID